MALYQIIKALQAASGSRAKLALLQEHKDNELLKAYLKATYDVSLSFYQKAVPKHGTPQGRQAGFDLSDIQHAIWTFAERNLTGDAAKMAMQKWLEDQNSEEDQELCRLLISRSVGAGVGDTMILKTWPDLYFIPGYMRCSLMTDKIQKHFEGLKEVIVQKKADGSFCYLKKASDGASVGFTRAGSHYPVWLVEKLLVGSPRGNYVYVGELLVYKNRKLLDRQTGNGIYNSILKGADESEFADYSFLMEAWDVLPTIDFERGLCEIEYRTRFETLERHSINTENLQVIDTDFVDSLASAYKVYSHYTSEGFEGAVVKDGSSYWKDHTSPFNVKLKIAFEAEYVVTGTFEGEGKYKGMLGGYNIETSDGLLKSSVGTGFTDAMRKNPPAKVGDIVTVIANDVVSRKDIPFKSLFLPVYSETRMDRKEADTLARVMEQLSAAKGMK